MGGDEVFRLTGDNVGNVFILPQSGFATGHPANAGDAVDDGIIMSLAGFQLHEFRIFFARRPVAHFMVVVDGDGVLRVEADYTAVLYKYAWHAVYRCRNDKFVVEADALGVGGDLSVEVCAALWAQSQVPFAYRAGGVSCIFQHVCHGDAGGVDDKFRVAGGDAGIRLSPRVHSCEESEAGRGAGGGGGVGIGELYALSGEAVDVGGAHFGGSVAAKVADAEVVGEYIDNVRLLVVWCLVLLGCVVASGQ